jgi:anti-sigma B factor antagonist
MKEPTAKLLVAVFDRVVCFRIEGRADFTSSVDLKKLIAELWARGYHQFVFDVCQCTMMDSTFLGMLAGVAINFTNGRAPGPDDHRLELVNSSAKLRDVFENLGMAHLFKFSERTDPLTDKYEPLAKSDASTPVELARTCLEAHRTLMSIRPENEAKFKDVAAFLAEDVKRLEITGKK